MNKWLHNQKGVTVLEGVIALGLLAIITAGSFGVLLATSRQATQPDMREEMALAVEKANDKLKAMLLFGNTGLKDLSIPYMLESYRVKDTSVYNLCPKKDAAKDAAGNLKDTLDGLTTGKKHNISCLLPPICDDTNSVFEYEITADSSATHGAAEDSFNTGAGGTVPALYRIEYTISCNGYQL